VAGVLIIIPLAVTAILIRYVYNAALAVGVRLINWFSRAVVWAFDATVGIPATVDSTNGPWYENAVLAMAKAAKNPPKIDPSTAEWYQNVTAVVLTVLMLYLLGWLGTNVVGRRVIGLVEGLLERIPMVATVYSAIKRMVGVLFGGDKSEDSTNRVVLIDFPHENMKAIAFLTNQLIDRVSEQKMATVYIPTTPNPTSGYMLLVPVERITETDWTMEEALSMVLSGGATAKPEVRLKPPGGVIFPGSGSASAGRQKRQHD
jgi:uncharacterized membrane protein